MTRSCATLLAYLLMMKLVLLCSAFGAPSLLNGLKVSSLARRNSVVPKMSKKNDADLLIRALKGLTVERTPVWLMRQAGRYMADFRKYSEKYAFRERSETPEIAIELSLQPWRQYGVDGVILFSDILTPLPAMGIDFTIVPGHGPKILKPVRSVDDIRSLSAIVDPERQVPFLKPTLQALRKETEGRTSLIGFIGAPWTLAAYSVEGGHSKLCAKFKRMCLEEPAIAALLLDKLADSLCTYASHQIECGAQVLQIFESWAHHLSQEQFVLFAKPYAARIARYLKEKHPEVPVVYFANGGSAFLQEQLDLGADALAVDWRISMQQARAVAGPEAVLAGNVDPMVLYGSEAGIRAAVNSCVQQAGRGGKHVLNLGHGVEKDTPEHAVQVFVDAAREFSTV